MADPDYFARFAPSLFLLLVIGTVQLRHDFVGWPLVVVAVLLGLITASMVRRRLVAWVLTLAVAFFLLSFSFVHSLHVHELQPIGEGSPAGGAGSPNFLKAAAAFERRMERKLEQGLEKGMSVARRVTESRTTVATTRKSSTKAALPHELKGDFFLPKGEIAQEQKVEMSQEKKVEKADVENEELTREQNDEMVEEKKVENAQEENEELTGEQNDEMEENVSSLVERSDVLQLETLSVVLPCSFEGNFALQTVQGILNRTRPNRLLEILVVDDGSQPPLSMIFTDEMLADRPGRAQVRILRHEKTLGLIAAKQTGGDAAKGDVIVFFDCHVLPRLGWEEAFLKQMTRMGDHKTVVVPTITSLDPDTWEEIEGGPVSVACFALLNGDFTWIMNPGRDVPLMSGGLLAMSRQWWQETEGYDTHMVAWGGENIDQSVRTWLCGGRIEAAQGAYVAHMWRDANKPKTRLKYPMPSKDVMRNKARAITAWFGSFKDKVFSFPEYEPFRDHLESVGNMSNFDHIKDKLQCQGFSSYLSRFSYVYFGSGLVPETIYQLREVSSGMCLERLDANGDQPHKTALQPCAGPVSGDLPYPGSVKELQLWHGANRNSHIDGRPCCSGFMNWNFMQCLDAQAPGSTVTTFDCSMDGHAPNQLFELTDDGQLVFRPAELLNLPAKAGRSHQHPQSGCVAPMKPRLGSATFQPHTQCSTRVQAVEGTDSFYLRKPGADGEDMCGTAEAADSEPDGPGWILQFVQCNTEDPQQVFHQKHASDEGFFVNVGESEMCLDSASGSKILVYPCYSGMVNRNQMWHILDDKLLWQEDSCVDAAAILGPDHQEGKHFSLQTCSEKPGQRIRRHEQIGDGFLLLDEDSQQCLGAVGSNLELVDCGTAGRWTQTDSQVRYLGHERRVCLDASVESHVKVGPCRQYRHQFFHVSDFGWINTRIGWDDNGRKRHHERCLDYSPVEPVKLIVEDCRVSSRRGVRWEKTSVSVPAERTLWTEMEKPPFDAPPLGSEPDIPK